MNEAFVLPVRFKGKKLLFPSNLLTFGHTYRIEVDVFGTEVMFERDEERNFRAIINPEKLEKEIIDGELLRAILEAIEQA